MRSAACLFRFDFTDAVVFCELCGRQMAPCFFGKGQVAAGGPDVEYSGCGRFYFGPLTAMTRLSDLTDACLSGRWKQCC